MSVQSVRPVTPRPPTLSQENIFGLERTLHLPALVTLFRNAGLPDYIANIQGRTVAFARTGWADGSFRTATVESVEVSVKRKTVTLELSARYFLAGERPVLQYQNGVWKLYVEGPNKHTFGDIELAFL